MHHTRRVIPRGGLSVTQIGTLAITGVLFTMAVWAAKIGLTYFVVTTAASQAVQTVATSGCWTTAATMRLQAVLQPLAGILPPASVTIVQAPAAYTPYGQPVTVSLAAPVGLWGGSGTTFQVTQTTLSIAPAGPSAACTTPPTTG